MKEEDEIEVTQMKKREKKDVFEEKTEWNRTESSTRPN